MKKFDSKKFKEEIIITLDSIDEQFMNLSKQKEEVANDIINNVVSILNNHRDEYYNLDEEEIFQEVYKCLLNAALVNSSNLNGGYESYIHMLIKEELELLFLKNKINIHTSEKTMKLICKYLKIIARLSNELQKEPTSYELAFILSKEESEVEEMLNLYNTYKDMINFSQIDLEKEDSYIMEDKYNIELRELISKLINKSNLSIQELNTLILHHGLILGDNNKIFYNGKNIILDGKPQNLEYISKTLDISHQRCSQLLNQAYYKIRTSDTLMSLGLIEYATNPDLALRMQDIYNWINSIPFTDKYPSFNSYFKEYSDIEIQTVINELNFNSTKFIKQLEKFNIEKTNFIYETSEKKKLFILIQNIYNSLIQKYGRRSMITNLESCPYIKYGQYFDKFRDLYKNFLDEYDEKTITYAITKLNDYQRILLFQIFGNNLRRVLKPIDIFKLAEQTISSYDILIKILVQELKKIKSSNEVNNFTLNKINLTSYNNDLAGIYRILSSSSVDLINKAIDNLFQEELNILKKVFGQELKDNDYTENLKKLSQIELAIFNSVISKIEKFLLMKKNEELSKEKKIKAKLRQEKRLEIFYDILILYGYKQEVIMEIFKNKEVVSLIKEYFREKTTKKRKEEIIKLICEILDKKYNLEKKDIKYNLIKEKRQKV